jgi:hypothetical protein
VYNATYIGFTADEMIELDSAYGKALEFVRTTQQRLGTTDMELGSYRADVASALKHHFKLDITVAHRISIGSAWQQQIVNGILSVYKQIEFDLLSGMTYEKGTGSDIGNTARFNPHEITIDPPFFENHSDDRTRARDLIHEQAHYASRAPGNFDAISDRGWWPWWQAYYEINPTVYKNLTTDQALTNADCYAWFAWELASGLTWPGYER